MIFGVGDTLLESCFDALIIPEAVIGALAGTNPAFGWTTLSVFGLGGCT
jgi:hypothetical protein